MSAKEAVVDTNVYIHALIEDSARHRDARRLIDSLARIFIPSIVLYEIVWVLRKLELGAEKIENVIDAILGDPRTNLVSDDGNYSLQAIRQIVKEKIDLSNFNDKVVLATAASIKIPVATYDRELRREAKAIGLESLG